MMQSLRKKNGFGAIDAMLGGALIFGISYMTISGFKKNLSMRSEIYVDGYAANFENEIVSNLHDIFERWTTTKAADSSGCKSSYNGEFQAIAADPQTSGSGIQYRLVTDRSPMYDANVSDPNLAEVRNFVSDVFCTSCLWGTSGRGPLRGVFELLPDPNRNTGAVHNFLGEHGPVYVAIQQSRVDNEWHDEISPCTDSEYNTKGSFDVLQYTILWKNNGAYKKVSGLKHLYSEKFVDRAQRSVHSLGLLDDALGHFFINLNEDSKAEKTIVHALNDTPGTITPLVGNWPGSTAGDTIGYYSASTRTFKFFPSIWEQSALPSFSIAIHDNQVSPIWTPLVGDWLDTTDMFGNSSPGDEVALYNPETREFRIYDLSGYEQYRFTSPCVGSIPLAGKWDGSGQDGIAFFNPDTNNAYLVNDIYSMELSSCPVSVHFTAVEAGWTPIVGAWNRPQALNEEIAFYSPSKGKFYFPHMIQGTSIQYSYSEDNALAFGPASSSMKPFGGAW